MKYFEQMTYQVIKFHNNHPKLNEPIGGFESLVGQMTFVWSLIIWTPSYLFIDTKSTLYIIILSACNVMAAIGIFQAIYYSKRYKARKIKNDPHPFSERFYKIAAFIHVGIPTIILTLMAISGILFLIAYAIYCLFN